MAFVGFEKSPQDDARTRSEQIRRGVHLAGGLCSIALLLGAAVWGYRLAVRDVTGIPVIRALDGAMRVAPADPGGSVAPHMGLAVNAVMAGQAQPPGEALRLAPAALSLSPEDEPGLGAAPRPAAEMAAVAAPAAPPAAGPADDADAQRVRSMVEAIVASVQSGDSAPAPLAGTDAAVAAALAGSTEAGPRPVRPRARPAPGDQAGAGADALAGSIAATLRNIESTAAGGVPVSTAAEIDPATLAPGTRLAQIGVYPDAEAARAGWDRIAASAGALMDGKARVLQSARSGGRDFVRLRVRGFDSEDDARRFCAAIETGELRCIPVTHR
jgi:hypothetical protein